MGCLFRKKHRFLSSLGSAGAFLFFLLAACSNEYVYAPKNFDAPADDDTPIETGPTISDVPFVGGPVIFTEIDPVNLVYKDHEGGDGGWVEVFNTSTEPVNLLGKHLTNSLDKPTRWTFGNVVVPPQSFMVVFLSGKDLPDFEPPSDSISLIGSGCWKWTDSQAEPVAGFSYAKNLMGYSKLCFKEQSERRFGSIMKFGDNADLGWTSISVMIGTGTSDPEDVVDLSNTNEILMRAYITKDRKVSFRLVQTGLDDWKGHEIVFTGTGDSSTVYRATLPTGTTLPDLEHIYGTRMSPESKESQEVTVKVFNYLARKRGHEPHASFKSKKSGGSLYLMDESGAIMDSLRYPEIPIGKSWSMGALVPNDASTLSFGFSTPSPYGFTEGAVIPFRSPSIDTLSELPPSGFYQEPFAVFFPEDKSIRCEVGGKAPSANSPLVSALPIEKTTVLRCASFVPGTLSGEILNRTYVFEKAPTVPAFFLTGDPGSLFDPDTGIYMEGNFAQEADPHYGANYWQDKEIPIFVEMFEKGVNVPVFSENAGFEIFGNYSRMNPKKSVAITFKEKYGKNRLKYPLFPEFPQLTSFKGFVLRDNGSNFGNDYIRDMLVGSISEGLGVDYQRGRASVVYYNGEYYGIHNIRERSTEYYFETHYGMDPKSIDLLKADNSASAGSSVEYQAMMDWLESHHLDTDANYAVVASQIDVYNFMNYVHTELFVDNRDWPSNNLKKWRSSNPKTLWKWFIYDTDFGFDSGMSAFRNNIFEFATAEDGDSWPNGPASTLLLRRLLEYPGFKIAFINRMSALLSMNFESSRVKARIDKLMAEINFEIDRDMDRWNHDEGWFGKQLTRIKSFAQKRPAVVLKEMQEFFALGTVAPVTLSVEGSGSIAVHDLELDQPSVTIDFFEGNPVVLSAVPKSGGVFAQWSDGETSPTRIIEPGKVTSVVAIFK